MNKEIKTLNVSFPLKYFKKMQKTKESMEKYIGGETLSWDQAIYAAFTFWENTNGKRTNTK